MKGFVNFLEKAGLVTLDEPVEQAAPIPELSTGADFTLGAVSESTPVATAAGEALNLDEIYAKAGISPSAYPAERLIRLIEGLSAMDDATRLMAIKAMDAADESWTINDPLADASAKIQALSQHAERLQANLSRVEQETKAQLDAASAKHEQVIGDIRKQMAELDALIAREMARAAQETAEHEASLKATRDQTARDLAQLSQTCTRLQALATQFGTTVPSQEQ